MGAFFLVSSTIAVLGAGLMVVRRNPVYGLLFLLLSFGGVAGVFFSLQASFLAVAQVLVYAGAIAVLFLFVLMFVNLRREGDDDLPVRVGSLAEYDPAKVPEPRAEEPERFAFRLPAAVFAVTLLMVLGWVIMRLPADWDQPFANISRNMHGASQPGGEALGYFGSVRDFGQAMMRDFWLHFEVIGLVVLIGVMGAVVLGKRISAMQRNASQDGAPKGH